MIGGDRVAGVVEHLRQAFEHLRGTDAFDAAMVRALRECALGLQDAFEAADVEVVTALRPVAEKVAMMAADATVFSYEMGGQRGGRKGVCI